MISTQQAIDIIRENRPQRSIEKIPLKESSGRVLVEDILAPEPSPRYTNSAMDGFAVKWADVMPASMGRVVTLELVGESQAGIPYPGSVLPGQAIRISTGAMLAADVDTVIRVEDTKINANRITILRADRFEQDVRFSGEEFKTGDLLLNKGTELHPPQLALLASVGILEVPVYRRPGTAVIITGTELVSLDQKAEPHQIRDSNIIMLTAAIKEGGGRVTFTGQVDDNLDSTVAIIQKAAINSSIIIFSGGVSVGIHDHVKEAAEQAGFTQLFWRVHQKPGKPLFCARRGETLLFGLPGNPVSAFMGYIYYIQPLIWDMQGKEFTWKTVKARLTATITNTHGRTNFLRALLQEHADGYPVVTVFEKQGSHMLTSIARTDSFIILGAKTTIDKGEWVDVYLFPWKA